jgi:hypothetical protein
MVNNSSTVGSSADSAHARSEDPAWAHALIVPESKNNTICLYCNKLIKMGGITRLKYHLAGIMGQVEPSKSALDDVKWQMKQMIEDLKKSKETKRKINVEIGNPYGDPIDVDEEEEEEGGDVVAKSVSQSLSKRARGKDVQTMSGKKVLEIQNYFAPRTTHRAQLSIKKVSWLQKQWLIRQKWLGQNGGLILIYHLMLLILCIINLL